MNPATIKTWLSRGEFEKLERVVLEGRGARLLGEQSPDLRTRVFLKSLPNYLTKISQVHEAATEGNLTKLQQLVLSEPKKKYVLAKDPNGVPLLHKAVYYDHRDVIEWLLENNPQIVSEKDRDGRTALHYCFAGSNPDEVWDLLINAGFDASVCDKRGHPAAYYLNEATETELPEIDEMRERRGSNGKVEVLDFKPSNIRIWIHNRDIGKLQQVLWEGHGSKLQRETSNNPRVRRFLEAVPYIMVTIKQIHSSVVKNDVESLLKKIADPVSPIILCAKDCNGLNVLHKAAGLGYLNIVQEIVEKYPAAANAPDNDGKIPLHYAAALRDNGTMYDLLVENGADESKLDNRQKAAAFYRNRPGDIDLTNLVVVPDAPRVSTTGYPKNWDWRILENDGVPLKAMKKRPIPVVNDDSAFGSADSTLKSEESLENVFGIKEPEDAVEETPEEEEEENPEENVQDDPSEAEAEEEPEPDEPEPELEPEPEAEDDDDVDIVEAKSEDENDVEDPSPPENDDEDPNPPENDDEDPSSPENEDQVEEVPAEGDENGNEESEDIEPVENEKEDDEEIEKQDEEEEEEGASKEAEEEEEDSGVDETRNDDDQVIAGEHEELPEKDLNEGSMPDDPEVEDLLVNGNMEQLAALVLNGEGRRLVGRQSGNVELQAFIDNVPSYIGKIHAVHVAAREGNLRDLQGALDRRKFAVARDGGSPHGATPLHVAVVFGHTAVIRYLAGRFPETAHAIDIDGRTPLHYAATLADNGHYYNLLLHLGANPLIQDNFSQKADYYRENQDDLSHKQLLRDFGAREELADEMLTDKDDAEADIPIFREEEGRYLASSLGDPLIKGLTEVANTRPKDPVTYLATFLYNFASTLKSPRNESPKEYDVLIIPEREQENLDADNTDDNPEDDVVEYPNSPDSGIPESAFSNSNRDEHGQSMLHFAVVRTHQKNGLFHLLQEKQINVGFRDELYRTARDVAEESNFRENMEEIDRFVVYLAARGETEKLVELLLEGYDHILDAEDNGVNIVDIAAERNREATVQFLQSIPNYVSQREEVHRAIRANDLEAAKEVFTKNGGGGTLLAVGKNHLGRCALHIAVLGELVDMIKYIVKLYPETLRIGDNLDRTALHYAMGVPSVEELSGILIKAGAKRVHKDLKSRQPSYYFMNKSDIQRLQEEEQTMDK